MQRGLKTYTTLRAALISVVLCLVYLALMTFGSALPQVNTAVTALTMTPVYLLLVGLIAGLLPAACCLAAILAALAITGGGLLLGFGAAFLLPFFAVFVICLKRHCSFWTACGALIASLIASQMVLFLILRGMTEGQLYQQAGFAAMEMLQGQDTLLYALGRAGVPTLPDSMQSTALLPVLGGGYTFSDEARRELSLQVAALTAQLLQSLVPVLMLSGSALTVLSGLGLGSYYGHRAAARRAYSGALNAPADEGFDMPSLSLWHIPRPWGLRIGLFAIGYLLMHISRTEAVQLLGSLMWQTFSFCFTVQGLAAINASQHRRGTKRGWRVVTVAAAFLLSFMQTALMIVGVIDQITNARGLRPKGTAHKEEE